MTNMEIVQKHVGCPHKWEPKGCIGHNEAGLYCRKCDGRYIWRIGSKTAPPTPAPDVSALWGALDVADKTYDADPSLRGQPWVTVEAQAVTLLQVNEDWQVVELECIAVATEAEACEAICKLIADKMGWE